MTSFTAENAENGSSFADALDGHPAVFPLTYGALEAVAGELRGEDPAAWREWFDSLPEGVVAPDGA